MVLCARIIDSKSSIFNPPYSVSSIEANRLIISFSFQIKPKNYLLATCMRSFKTWIGKALDIKLGMVNDLTICILPIRMSPLHFRILYVFFNRLLRIASKLAFFFRKLIIVKLRTQNLN